MAHTVRSIRKLCRICGEDCSKIPRVTDQHGHYYCQACARAYIQPEATIKGEPTEEQSIDQDDLKPEIIEAIRAETGATDLDAPMPIDLDKSIPEQTQADDGATADVTPPPVTLAASAYGDHDEISDDDIIPLAPEDHASDVELKSCPVCFHRYPPDTHTCINCGFNEERGIASSRFVEKSRAAAPVAPIPLRTTKSPPKLTCPHCDYDMTGAPSMTCPECGKAMPTRSQHLRAQIAHDTIVEAYRTPAIQLAAGTAILMILGTILIGPIGLIVYPVSLIVQAGVGLIVFYACCLLWIGFDAPLKLNALRLLSIYAVTGATEAFFGLVPIPFIGWIIPLIVFVGMFTKQMEVDNIDAVAYLVLTFILWIAIAMFVLQPAFAALGLV